MISNNLLKQRILDLAIRGELVDNDVMLPKPNIKAVDTNDNLLPSNWVYTSIDIITNIVNGFTPLRTNKEFWNTNEINWFTIDDMRRQGGIITETEQFISKKALGSSTNRLLPPETVLLCCTASVGECAITKIELTTNQQFNGLIVKSEYKDSVSPYYLYWYCKTLKNKLLDKAGKTTINFVSTKKLGSVIIPIPPIEEQKKIVSKIEELFALIDQKEKNDQEKDKLKLLLKDKILDSAIRGELVDNDLSLQPVDVEAIDGEVPFDIPSNWKWSRFDSASTIVRGGSPRPIKDYITESDDGINWIKIGDTSPNEFYINSVKEKIKPEGMKKSRFVEKGSLLLSNSMSFGRPYILNVDGCIHDGWLNIKSINNSFDNMYMVYLLSSKFFYNVMCGKSSGAVVSNLNIDKVKSMLIPFPPLEQQKKIVDKIEQCFKLIEQL